MKKIFFIALGVLLLISFKINAQIIHEHTYPGPNTAIEARPVIINIGEADYKYMYVDYVTNQLRLFNLDHSEYNTVNIPVQLVNSAENTIGYVSKSLFDCDTTMFEYAIFPVNYRNTFYIYRQDGTQLFKKDSTLGPWCVGCYSGSYDQRPIYNTPEGAKLFLLTADSAGFFKSTDVYSLCGTLPIGLEIINNNSFSFVKAYPNPSGSEVNFDISLPSNYERFDLVIYNNNGAELHREFVSADKKKYSMNLSLLSSGLYTYSLVSQGKAQQSGKFILTK